MNGLGAAVVVAAGVEEEGEDEQPAGAGEVAHHNVRQLLQLQLRLLLDPEQLTWDYDR